MVELNTENTSGIGPTDPWSGVIAKAKADEREACAKVAEEYIDDAYDSCRCIPQAIAARIRARTDNSF